MAKLIIARINENGRNRKRSICANRREECAVEDHGMQIIATADRVLANNIKSLKASIALAQKASLREWNAPASRQLENLIGVHLIAASRIHRTDVQIPLSVAAMQE